MSDDKENIKQEKKNKKLLNIKKTYKFIGFILISFFLILFVLYSPKNLAKFEKNKPNKEITKTEISDCHNCFILGPNMNFFHNGPAILLDNGNILVTGGYTKQAEIYDYKKNEFVLTKGKMNYIRSVGATATKLNNGNVLITGGATNEQSFESIPNEEIYNSNTGIFSKIPNMCIPRADHTAILMDNGNVLIFGGNNSKTLHIQEIEEFNYLNNSFRIINKINNIPNVYWQNYIHIGQDKILLIGYTKGQHKTPIFYIYEYYKNRIYKFNPKPININDDIKEEIYISNISLHSRVRDFTNKNGVVTVLKSKDIIKNIIFTSCEADIGYTATFLDKNKIIFIGGYDDTWGWGLRLLKHISIYTKNSLITKNIGLNIPRYNHQAIQINNGNIIIIGGYKQNNGIRIPLKTIEIYYK